MCVRRNFLCGLQGREPHGLADLNSQLREWVGRVANQRVDGTTREQVAARWEAEQLRLQPMTGRAGYRFVEGEVRKVAHDAYVDWQGSRYSVPWPHVGKEVWVREIAGAVEVHDGRTRIAVHPKASRKHEVMTCAAHHRGIPLGAPQAGGNILIHVRQTAPMVEIRPLAAYKSAAIGGGR
ncbi:MAG: hypothetical protein HY649_07355 [Acidobacteria bacterium]|nr:hypothetical protein [Acidobacteriota bacterium]